MTDAEKPHLSSDNPLGATVVRLPLRPVVAIFAMTMAIVMMPLGLLIPAPPTAQRVFRIASEWWIARLLRVRNACAFFFKKSAQAVEGRGCQLISDVSITTLYYEYTARRHVKPCIFLAIATSLLLVLVTLCKPSNSVSLLCLACVQCVLCVLLSVRIRLLRYRINTGVFGTSPQEIRDTIGFMMRESNNIDFTDGSGKRLPSLPSGESASTDASNLCPEGVRA
jgi:hypothetical protein